MRIWRSVALYCILFFLPHCTSDQQTTYVLDLQARMDGTIDGSKESRDFSESAIRASPLYSEPFFMDIENHLSFPIRVSDGDKLPKFVLVEGPSAATINPAGVLSWKPPLQNGVRNETIIATAHYPNGEVEKHVFDIQIKPLKKVLLVLAHQDDDVGVAPFIAKLVKKNVDVFGIWVAGANDNPETCTKRKQESLKAMGSLGVDASNLSFYCYPDRKIGDNIVEIYNRLSVDIPIVSPDLIFVTAYEAGHMDHDLVHVLTTHVAHKSNLSAPIYEVPLYSARKNKLNLIPTISALQPLPSTMPCMKVDYNFSEFKKFLKYYPSQTTILDFIKLALSKEAKEHLCFTKRPNWNYLEPPSAKILYEINPAINNPQGDYEKSYARYVRQLTGQNEQVSYSSLRPSEQILYKILNSGD